MKSVFVLDDHKLFLTGLQLLISSIGKDIACKVFDEAGLLMAALEHPSQNLDLVIMDFYVPGCNVPDLIAQLSDDLPTCKFLIVSASINPSDERRSLDAGADLFLSKAVDPLVLVESVSSLLKGEIPASTAPASTLLAKRFELTPRQLEILVLVSKGLSNKEVAKLLAISPETTKSHLRDIYQRFGVANRIEAIDFAREHGLN
ncbi:MAG: response regulator transcription factor [Hyphomicrobiales bacterium]